MSFKPLTKEDIYGFESDDDGFYLDDVRSAVEGLKADMFDFYHEIGKATIWRASNDEVADLCEAHALKLVDKWFPVFSQSLSEDAKINDGCSQQVTSAPSSEAKSSVSHHVSMGAATVSVATILEIIDLMASIDDNNQVWGHDTNLGDIDVLVDKIQNILSLSQAPEHEYTEGILALASVKHGSDAGEKSGTSHSQPSVHSEEVESRTQAERSEQHGVPAGELSSVSVGEVDVKHAARKGCTCKHGSGAITKRFVEENKLCKCECHKVKE